MKKRFVTWLKQVALPDIYKRLVSFFWKIASKKGVDALAEDARKIGVNSIGIGLVGILVDSASIPRAAALLVLVCGVIIWLVGLLLTSSETLDKE
ncbi:MAG: hypothetical protein PHP32_07750 [Candidatus Izemoplasmatales bacterium]|nr:hypothetical protein [Candidatus Izemoplasmatales bacterium]